MTSLLENAYGAVDGGQIAFTGRQGAVDLLDGLRMSLLAEQIENGLARAGDTPVLAAQPSSEAGKRLMSMAMCWHGGSMLVQQDAAKSGDSAKNDGDGLVAVELVAFTGFKQDGGGDVHEDADNDGNELAVIMGQHSVVARQCTERGHGSEEAEQQPGGPATQ